MPLAGKNAAARAHAHIMWAERYSRRSGSAHKASAHFGRALEYEQLAYSKTTFGGPDFRIIIETERSEGGVSLQAKCIYKGHDTRVLRFLEDVNLDPTSLALLDIVFFSKEQEYRKHKYQGKIFGFQNSFTQCHATSQYKDRFQRGKSELPVLENLTGIGRGMLVSCICKALDEGLIDPSCNIVVEACGNELRSGMGPRRSTEALVRYYELIGFTQMFPESYNDDVEKISVLMIAMAHGIIEKANIGSFSPDLLEVLQIQGCKGASAIWS
jgi:hypothetical protein